MPIKPVTIVVTVLSTTRAINAWLQAKDRKKSIIDDLVKLTQMLCDILQPLQEPRNIQKLNKNVLSVLLETAETLSSIKAHLALLQAKTTSMTSILGCLSPMTALAFLEDDREKLKERAQLLTLALQLAATPDVEIEVEGARESLAPRLPIEYHLYHLKGVRNIEVREFWGRNFPQDFFAFDSVMPLAIRRWTNERMDEYLENALIRAIDPNDVGFTTPKGLANLVGNKTIKGAIRMLKADIAARGDSALTERSLVVDTPPTLVWIDNPKNNLSEVLRAQGQGVKVVEIPSTPVAKIWIQDNYAHLKQLESTNKLRFITHNNRWERDGRKGEFMNLAVGELVLRFLRGSGFNCPVLVYSGVGVLTTQYVLKFSRAGSTAKPSVCIAFIKELAVGVDTRDFEWRGFNIQEVTEEFGRGGVYR